MSDIQVFDNGIGGKLRAGSDEQGQLWFAAADVAAALGYSSAKDLTRNLDDDEKGRRIVPTPGGNQELSTITEPGLYHSLNMRRAGSVKDDATRAKVKAFQHQVNHEILPSISRDGGYMVAREDESDDVVMARALIIADKALKRKDKLIAEQVAQIDEMRPKALFADAVAASDGTCLVGELAKMMTQAGFTVGQNRLFAILRNDGYLGKSGSNRNVPLQRYVEQGLFKIKETAVSHADGHVTINRTPKITGRGQRYFIDHYCKQECMN